VLELEATPETLAIASGIAPFATIYRGERTIVIDKGSVLSGFMLSNNWPFLLNWAERRNPRLGSILVRKREAGDVAAYYAEGGAIIASRSMLATVIPRARELLVEMPSLSGQLQGGHLLLSLLEHPDIWKDLSISPSHAEIAELQEECRAILRSEMRSPAHEAEQRVPVHSDDPALVDRLGRLPFARVLAARIVEVQQAEKARNGPDRAFMVHLHGPWGSGKSSVLAFLRGALKAQEPSWTVIDFNAWQHHAHRPSWWSVVTEVRRQAALQADRATRLRLFAIWWRWRLRADLLPILISALFVGLAVFGLFSGTVNAEDSVKWVGAAIAAGGALYALSRTVVFGSTRAAKAYDELETNPYGPVVELFGRLVRAIGRPVAVCIDDLDRCDSASVTDLLEGIQTLLRDAPIIYVVAGDRKWICASFEKRYGDFSNHVGEPGRPLGYLFLDKVFQISTSIPRLSAGSRARFWNGLLGEAPIGASDAAIDSDAHARIARLNGQEELQREIDKAPAGSDRQAALRAAAAMQISGADARSANEHRFRSFAHLLERNPRAMKRLVNALGMNQALAFLEGRDVTPEVLARWTILELRWPVLADWLIESCTDMDSIKAPANGSIAQLLADREVVAVLGNGTDPGQLDVATLRALHA
jgi:hypothetical protein